MNPVICEYSSCDNSSWGITAAKCALHCIFSYLFRNVLRKINRREQTISVGWNRKFLHRKVREQYPVKVIVRVPATTANMGSGFDTIGMALNVWSEYHVEVSDNFEVINDGEDAELVPMDKTNLVCQAVEVVYKRAGLSVPPLKFTLFNKIPFARGLGSSSAAIIGGLLAGVALSGYEVQDQEEELLNMAAEIEGHSDNVAPALYGGIRIGILKEDRLWATQPVNLPPHIRCVCFIPAAIGTTAAARAVLNDMVKRSDAVFNIGRVAWLVNCLATENITGLKHGVEDVLHQPQRATSVYPYFQAVASAASAGGADAVYLSGAGPTIIALVHDSILVQCVSQAMEKTANEIRLAGTILITEPTLIGAHVADLT